MVIELVIFIFLPKIEIKMEITQNDGIHTFREMKPNSFSKFLNSSTAIIRMKDHHPRMHPGLVLILKVYLVKNDQQVMDLLFLSKVVLKCSGIGISSKTEIDRK